MSREQILLHVTIEKMREDIGILRYWEKAHSKSSHARANKAGQRQALSHMLDFIEKQANLIGVELDDKE